MLNDLRYAVRGLRKSPGFSLAVVLVLALGIGANTAIFSVVNAVLLQPLPFADPQRLIAIGTRTPEGRTLISSSAYPDFVDWKSQATTIEAMAGFTVRPITLTNAGESTSHVATITTADLFPLLGARPLRGRGFDPADDRVGAAPVTVVSETFWRQRLNADPDVVGRALILDGIAFTVAGVMPAAFQFPILGDRIEIWVPMAVIPSTAQFAAQRGAVYMSVVGRLRSGATLEQAQSELTGIGRQLAAAYPRSNGNRSVHAIGLRDALVNDSRLALIVLFGAVAVVLLIACANVANLLLARGTARHKELAIRTALGAGRGRLARQMLAESLILAGAGGSLGVLLAFSGVPALVAASPVDIPRLRDVHIDPAVLVFTVLVSLATGVVFGLVPALQLTRPDGTDMLKGAERASSNRRTTRTRSLLVVTEMALSLVLLAGAGLLVRTLLQLQRVDPGFVASHAIATDVQLPRTRYAENATILDFQRRLLAESSAIPGVTSSAVSTTLPMSGGNLVISYTVEGRPPPDPASRPAAAYFAVSADYFKTMGIAVREGRAFTDRDTAASPNVILISETMARKYWPEGSAVGQHITVGINRSGPREVVGVVADVKQDQLTDRMQPQMYTPLAQTPWPFMTLTVRTQAEPAAVASALRAAVVRVDREQPARETRTLEDYVARTIAAPRFNALLVGSFAALALLLAGLGLYAVMAYTVAQREREIGIRMALGAKPGDVRRMVVGQALGMGAVGLASGLAVALAATRVLSTLLFGVSPGDPLTFAVVSALLLGVVAAASFVPARHATRVDPMRALRAD